MIETGYEDNRQEKREVEVDRRYTIDRVDNFYSTMTICELKRNGEHVGTFFFNSEDDYRVIKRLVEVGGEE